MWILITGANGQVGSALAHKLGGFADLCLTKRQDLDLLQPSSISGALDRVRPDLIVNAAAYTEVDKAETERDLAFIVNAAAVEVMGAWAAQKNVPIIHFSTDYVFDGSATEPYDETHPINPLSAYGESKAEGERLLLKSGADCLIVRTAWVYSAGGKNFLKTIVRLAMERDELAIVADQIGSPTSADQIADFIGHVLRNGPASLPALFKQSNRLVHLTGSGFTSWHGFADAIVKTMKRYGVDAKASSIKPIPSSEYPMKAIRPKFSRLSMKRLNETFGYYPDTWESALDKMSKELFIGDNLRNLTASGSPGSP